jgi:hypothetical protein
MPILGKLAIAAALRFCALGVAGQDLAPLAYVITPLNSNAITLTYSYYTGGLQFDGAVPITGATAQLSVGLHLLLLAEFLWALSKHPGFVTLWRGKSLRKSPGRRGASLPVRAAGFCLPLFGEPEGRTGAAA